MFLYRKCLTVIAGLLFLFFNTVSAQKVALKSNLLYDATGSINLGVELALALQWTLDVSGNYNAWDFFNDNKWRHILVQPEARYWLCEKFNGHFLGIHVQWMKFNIGSVDMPFGLWDETRNSRFQGDLWGGGLAYGYNWLLSRHWNLEAEVGVGYGRVIYDKYPCASCGNRIDSSRKNYFGPTKLALNLVYIF